MKTPVRAVRLSDSVNDFLRERFGTLRNALNYLYNKEVSNVRTNRKRASKNK